MVAIRVYKGWEIVWQRSGWVATKGARSLGPMEYDDLIAEINRKES